MPQIEKHYECPECGNTADVPASVRTPVLCDRHESYGGGRLVEMQEVAEAIAAPPRAVVEMIDCPVCDEHMIPRAVVNEYECPECGYRVSSPLSGAVYCAICAGDSGRDVRLARVNAVAEQPTPRAVVALSEDRQWLVVHRYLDDQFCVMREFSDYGYLSYKEADWVQDTGQSADQVLAQWLEGRGG